MLVPSCFLALQSKCPATWSQVRFAKSCGVSAISQAQQALLLGKQTLTKKQTALPYSKLASAAAAEGDAFASELLAVQPELVHLERCLRTHLSALQGGSPLTPTDWASSLPHANDQMVSLNIATATWESILMHHMQLFASMRVEERVGMHCAFVWTSWHLAGAHKCFSVRPFDVHLFTSEPPIAATGLLRLSFAHLKPSILCIAGCS